VPRLPLCVNPHTRFCTISGHPPRLTRPGHILVRSPPNCHWRPTPSATLLSLCICGRYAILATSLSLFATLVLAWAIRVQTLRLPPEIQASSGQGFLAGDGGGERCITVFGARFWLCHSANDHHPRHANDRQSLEGLGGTARKKSLYIITRGWRHRLSSTKSNSFCSGTRPQRAATLFRACALATSESSSISLLA